MIGPDHPDLSIGQRCKLLPIARLSYYYFPKGETEQNLDLTWRGFLYLVAIMGWHTRKVLSWRISNMLEADFCVEALNEALHKFGLPEIVNTDQGAQFTSFAWTDRLRRIRCADLDGWEGRFLDNIFMRGCGAA